MKSRITSWSSPDCCVRKRNQNEVAIRRTHLEHARSLSRERNDELVSDLFVEESLYIGLFKKGTNLIQPTDAA